MQASSNTRVIVSSTAPVKSGVLILLFFSVYFSPLQQKKTINNELLTESMPTTDAKSKNVEASIP